MTPRDFAYWLQGFFEIAGNQATLTDEQVEMVRRHLDTVFEHEAMKRSAESQRKLDEAHNPPGLKPSDYPNPVPIPSIPMPYIYPSGTSPVNQPWLGWPNVTTC